MSLTKLYHNIMQRGVPLLLDIILFMDTTTGDYCNLNIVVG